MNSRKSVFALVSFCLVVLTSVVLSQTPTNPTRVSDSMVAPPPTSFTAIWVVTPTGKVLVQPDASIKIDLTATPPVIRAVLPALPPPLQEQVDQWVASVGQTSFALSVNDAWPTEATHWSTCSCAAAGNGGSTARITGGVAVRSILIDASGCTNTLPVGVTTQIAVKLVGGGATMESDTRVGFVGV